MNGINLTLISITIAAVSAIFSLIGIIVNAHYSRKTYRANLQNKPKIELLNTIRKLIPEYIAAVEFRYYLYNKASANRNDCKTEEISFDDYVKQTAKAKEIYFNLNSLLNLQGNKELLYDIQELWSFGNQLGKYFNTSTNSFVSEKEKKFNHKFKQSKAKLNDDFLKFYKEKMDKLSK